MLELKLHVEFDRVAAEADVVWRISYVIESQCEAKLLSVELNRPLNVPRPKNGVDLLEHLRLRNLTAVTHVV